MAGNPRATGRCRWPLFLHAAGFHSLTFDVRGHGANPPEPLPLSAGEFGADALAAFRALLDRPEVTEAAIAGHSMGAIGAILAAAADPRVAAVVATSGPADPYRLTRQTFRLAHLPIPDVIAYPLAWLTTRVYLRPRGHRVADISAARAIARYAGRSCSPTGSSTRSCRRATWSASRPPRERPGQTTRRRPGSRPCSSRAASTRGCTRTRATAPSGRVPRAGLRRPAGPDEAAERAEATDAERIPDIESAFAAIQETPGGLRTLASVALPGATRPPRVDDDGGPVTRRPAAIPAAPTGEP